MVLVNEMTLVLLNDVDDSRMLHLFFVHVRAIMELRQSSRVGQLRSHMKQMINITVFSASVQKMNRKKDAQTLEHSSQ